MTETDSSSKEVVILAPLGPNPAPLVELAWGLAQEGLTVSQAVVVVDGTGKSFPAT